MSTLNKIVKPRPDRCKPCIHLLKIREFPTKLMVDCDLSLNHNYEEDIGKCCDHFKDSD